METLKKELQVGIRHKVEKVVTEKDTAIELKSGTLEVFATPMMVALMECTSKDLVQPYLSEGYSTVGTALDIKHISATRVGKKVWAEVELIEIDRKRLVFKVEAFDEDKKIGEGTHERFIVEIEKFMGKLK